MQQLIDFKQKRCKIGLLVTLLIDIKKTPYFMIKVVFFQKDQLGIGPHVRKWREMGQKLDFRAFFSEI